MCMHRLGSPRALVKGKAPAHVCETLRQAKTATTCLWIAGGTALRMTREGRERTRRARKNRRSAEGGREAAAKRGRSEAALSPSGTERRDQHARKLLSHCVHPLGGQNYWPGRRVRRQGKTR